MGTKKMTAPRMLRSVITAAILLAGCVAMPPPARADYDLADNFKPIRYTATSLQTVFAGTWPIETDAQVQVYVATNADAAFTLQTLDTDYTVTGEGGSGFTVTFGTGVTLNSIVVLDRDSGVDRSTDLTVLELTGVNTHFDRQTMHDQETEDIARRRGVQIGVGDDYNNGSGDTWIENVIPHVSTDVTGDALCFLSKTNADDGYRVDYCKGPGGGVCADCPTGTCSGGANDGLDCASESDCPGGSCDGFTTCDYISVADGVYVCSNGTCPDSYTGDDSGGCLDCGQTGTCTGGDNAGGACVDDTDCAGVCTNLFCEVSGDACTTNAQCSGTCDVSDDVCLGGSGDGDACTDDADCPDGGTCRPNDNVCFGGSEDTNPCTNDVDCPGLCTALACVGGPDDGTVCAVNADCVTACVDPDDLCDGCTLGDSGGGWVAQLCDGGDNHGDLCSTNTDCTGGTCGSDPCGSCGGLCTANADCGDSCACDVDNICLGGTNDGDGCTNDTDCPGVCTALVCVENGGTCATNSDCGGVCAPEFDDETCQGGTNDGDPCTDDADCPAGGTCELEDAVGVRMIPPVTDSCITLAAGNSGGFIECSRATIGPTGFLRDISALSFSQVVETSTAERVTLQPYPAATAAARLAAGAWYELPDESPSYLQDTNNWPSDTQFGWMSVDKDHGSVTGRTKTRWAVSTYPIHVFSPGVNTDAQLILRTYFTEPVVCLHDFAGSEVWNATAFTGSTVYTLQDNGSTIGTITCDTDAAPNECVIDVTAGEGACVDDAGACTTNGDCTPSTCEFVTNFAVGDYLDIDGPATADATGGNLSITLKCFRSANDEVLP